ncbi:MAG: hypothetical protein ACREJU_18895 [Nitrospiraceae bacterium]
MALLGKYRVVKQLKSGLANAAQRCNLLLGLALGLLVPSFFLFIACASPPPPEHTPPRAVLASAEDRSGPSPSSSQGAPSTPTALRQQTGISIPPSDVPIGDELQAWVESLARAGITLVLLDAGTREGLPYMGEPRPIGTMGSVYFRTGLAETARDVFGELIPVAHRHGLSVFAAVSLRRMNWVDPTLGWMDRSYDPVRLQLKITPYLDVFHPAFQEYLTGLFIDLADTGVDGVLFRNEAPLGPSDGLSFFALRGFERAFQIKADPAKLVPIAVTGMPAPADGPRADAVPTGSPEFWQWAGWKAREAIKVMAKLGRAMRTHAPALVVALEVHPEAVTDPLIALVQYGEDLLEAKRHGVQFFLVRAGAQQRQVSAPLLERMGQLVGEKKGIWVPVVLPGRDIRRPEEWGPLSADRERLDTGVGLIYMGELN